MSQTVRAALRTAVAVPTFFLFTWAMAAAIIFMSFIDKDSPAIDSIIRFWSRLFLTTAPLSLEVHGSEHIDPSRQYVFVANHLSNFDIPVMYFTQLAGLSLGIDPKDLALDKQIASCDRLVAAIPA